MPEVPSQGDADAASPDPPPDKVELLVRRILADEAGKFREDAIATLKLLVAAFFGVVVVAGVIGAWLFSSIFGETLESRAIDSIIGSQVDGALEREVRARAAEAVDEIEAAAAIAVDEGNAAISAASASAQAEAIQQITSRVEGLVTEQLVGPIQAELDRLQDQDVEEIISDVVRELFAEGAIVAFSREACPEGWQRFDAASGRFVLGTGQGIGLSERWLGETGGEEEVLLTIETMPTHSHDFRDQRVQYWVRDLDDVQVEGPSAGGGDFRPINQVASEGGGEPHNNMPPYIALHFCEYVGVQ